MIKVKKHKTSRQGAAKLVTEGMDKTRLDDYVTLLRPLMDLTGHLQELFILPGPSPLGESFNRRLKMLSSYYDLNLPTSNRVRKAGASTAASTLDAQGVKLMAKQMAHSSQTAERWYQMKETAQDSIDAFRTMQNIRKKSKPQQHGEEEQDYREGERSCQMKWTPEQEEVVSKFFAAVIIAEEHAPTSMCEACARFSPLLHNVPAKKIQDKVKTIIRQRRRPI